MGFLCWRDWNAAGWWAIGQEKEVDGRAFERIKEVVAGSEGRSHDGDKNVEIYEGEITGVSWGGGDDNNSRLKRYEHLYMR
jgi:hypothetical protein